jgi:hypothetical protein
MVRTFNQKMEQINAPRRKIALDGSNVSSKHSRKHGSFCKHDEDDSSHQSYLRLKKEI